MTTLSATTRTGGSAANLRAEGAIPAVIYGKGVKETISIALDRESFKKAWTAAGSSTAVTITGLDHEYDVIIHDFQIDPATDMVIHADLLALDKNTKVTVHVELEFTGTAPAVKSGLGILEKVLHEVEVEALPANLPKSLVVSIDGLEEVGSAIHVKDLALPKGVELKGHEGDDVVAVISAIKEEKEEDATPIDFAAIEVSAQKGKKAEEEVPAE
ncbi:MAG: ribosomal rRNA E-loop binding protein Ctc/L25/TL5, large subunit ribosomal protein [Patescibacteria group bacterium]|nr:ribosomal rRNA E-loop binding protein Ctc/L25/TL5, large subunit ribosomal protein [Patescibacteria group bacterium]